MTTASRSMIIVLSVIFCMDCGCTPSQNQEATREQADTDKQDTSSKTDYGQSPTPESLVATFRKWHQANQLEDAAERDKMMGLVYVSHDDVKTIFKDQAKRLQTIIDLQIALEKLDNLDRSHRLKIDTIEAVDVREMLRLASSDPERESLASISELFPENVPVSILRIRWKDRIGSTSMGPFFFLNNRWAYVTDPGDVFGAAIKNVSQEQIDKREGHLRRELNSGSEKAVNRSKDRAAKGQIDWLPDYEIQIQKLKSLGEFIGEKLVDGDDRIAVIGGSWCKAGDTKFVLFHHKLEKESLHFERLLLEKSGNDDLLAAHRKGDELGLLTVGNYWEGEWGEQRERWLLGNGGKWYFLNQQGELFQWDGQEVDGKPGKKKATGMKMDAFGIRFYADPKLLCCRPFVEVISGPAVLEKVARCCLDSEEGSDWQNASDSARFTARLQAHKRLTGVLFAPTPPATFDWTYDSLVEHVEQPQRIALRSDPLLKEQFDGYVSERIRTDFNNDVNQLCRADETVKLEMWYRLWWHLRMEPPKRETCIVVVLNDSVITEMSRVLDRQSGRLFHIALRECGIPREKLQLMRPPSPNGTESPKKGTDVLDKDRAAEPEHRLGCQSELIYVGGAGAVSDSCLQPPVEKAVF